MTIVTEGNEEGSQDLEDMVVETHTPLHQEHARLSRGRVAPAGVLTSEERAYVLESTVEYEIPNYHTLLLYLVSDIFTPLIGFKAGIVPLRRAGVDRIGDLVALSHEALAAIPGIGPRRVAKIEAGLELLQLSLGAPSPSWRPQPIPFHPRAEIAPTVN